MLVLHRSLDMAPELADKFSLPSRRCTNGQILAMIDGNLPASGIPVNDNPAGLAEDYPAGADVPGPATALPVEIEGSLGDAAEVEGRGAQSTGGVDHGAAFVLARAQRGPGGTLGRPVCAGAVGAELDDHDALVEAVDGRGLLERETHVSFRSGRRSRGVDHPHEAALPADAVVQLAGKGVEDHADRGDAVDREAQAHAHVGVAVDEVGRAVDRVDDEGRLRPQLLPGHICLFAHEAECWVQRLECRRDVVLDRAVCLRHQVGRVLLGAARCGIGFGGGDH